MALRVDVNDGVAFVTVDHPPVNLLDGPLVAELDRFRADVQDDPSVRVVVLQSADPEFFLSHGPLSLVVDPAALQEYAAGPGPTLAHTFRALPQVTIGKVAGRTRGGGNEFLLSLDMRFAALGRASFGQPEVSLGIFPGGGGTQLLPRAIGRARTLELVLGSDLIDAATAERYGLVNRALPADELDAHVDRLARRIASYPPEAVAAAKRAVDLAVLPLEDGLKGEAELLWGVFTAPAAVQRFRAALAAGAETREGELDLEGLIGSM